MRAGIYVERGAPVSVEDVDLLPGGENDVVVSVGASGVCHSDYDMVGGRHLRARPPTVLGHEGCGVVEAVGPGVTRVRPGDRVIAYWPSCGECFYCVRDSSHLCEGLPHVLSTARVRRDDGSTATAFTGLGTFADLMTVHEASLVKIESDLPDEQLALIGCGVTTGLGAALNTARVVPGSTVAVIACGGVGQAIVQGARIAGASRIIAVDPVELKRDTALVLGATDVIDPTGTDVIADVKELTKGRGVDYAFEVVGRPETFTQAFGMTRRGGTIVLVGVPEAGATLPVPGMALLADGKTVMGSVCGSSQARRDLARYVQLADTGQVNLDAMVSRTITLDDVNDSFRAMEAGEVIRSVIVNQARG